MHTLKRNLMFAAAQRHMFALLSLVQHHNTGTAGAGIANENMSQLKLKTASGSSDLQINMEIRT